MQQHVVPDRDLFSILNRVESPARYTGGEFGAVVKSSTEAPLRVAVSFPDLYEVGMSNTAVKLLYGMLNAIPGIACERVFVPAPDFETELDEAGIPLYTLETGTPVRDTHLLAISYGYELLATNVLTLLKSSHIPVLRSDREASDPVVILGGPGATNPLPMSPFVDGIFCGEAEAALPELVVQMEALRSRGATRVELLEVLEASPHVWTPAGTGTARRAIWTGFGRGNPPDHVPRITGVPASFGAGFPVPNVPVIQDHGPVEIMRGCPQGCRFCHAGVFYRPYRMKPVQEIIEEIDWLVSHQGYRDITLSSLSSGDYGELIPLLNRVNAAYRDRGISVQLPSLRVNSLTLPIFEQLSQGKRSGLTFAVETAHPDDQHAINKLVPLEQTIKIAQEAFERGWKHAKLYFMIGLPLEDPEREGPAIIEYVRELRRAVKMEFVVNVGTFVPKPHTPFQWDAQLPPEVAQERIAQIRRGLPKGVRLRAHDPWMSWLEGILTRGTEATGRAIARAHELGARLDAWGEYIRRDVWESVLAEIPEAMTGVQAIPKETALPWKGIDLGVRDAVLARERRRAEGSTTTDSCTEDCEEPCGVCNRMVRALDTAADHEASPTDAASALEQQISADGPTTNDGESHGSDDGNQYYLVVRYRKNGVAAFIPHLGLVRTFERVWQRLQIPLALSEGFHPKARMSFGQPLPLGVAGDDEIVVVSVQKNIRVESDYHVWANALPAGIQVLSAVLVRHIPQTPKIAAPMQRYGGSVYRAELVSSAATGEESVGGRGEIPRIAALIGAVPGVTILSVSDTLMEFSLGPTAPGLGRIIKNHGLRGSVRFSRIRMLDMEGGALFSYYASHPAAVSQQEVGFA